MAADLTLVTASIDIGRAMLSDGFARPFGFYRERLDALLGLEIPIVVYADKDLSLPGVRNGRKLVPTDHAALERFPYFDRVQKIRKSPVWRDGASWLAASPQAALRHYNPLVMSKLFWLAEQARANPFGTRYFAWIDGGITNTVPLAMLDRALRAPGLANYLRKFLLLCYPYRAAGEVHGFTHGALARYANVPAIEWVARGGFFGGSAAYVVEAARLYEAMLGYTLDQGCMGTEESVFTILAHLHPDIFERSFVHENGLVTGFFADLAETGDP